MFGWAPPHPLALDGLRLRLGGETPRAGGCIRDAHSALCRTRDHPLPTPLPRPRCLTAVFHRRALHL